MADFCVKPTSDSVATVVNNGSGGEARSPPQSNSSPSSPPPARAQSKGFAYHTKKKVDKVMALLSNAPSVPTHELLSEEDGEKRKREKKSREKS